MIITQSIPYSLTRKHFPVHFLCGRPDGEQMPFHQRVNKSGTPRVRVWNPSSHVIVGRKTSPLAFSVADQTYLVSPPSNFCPHPFYSHMCTVQCVGVTELQRQGCRRHYPVIHFRAFDNECCRVLVQEQLRALHRLRQVRLRFQSSERNQTFPD